MSTTIVSAVAIILAQLLPTIGVDLGPEAIETTIQTIVAVIGGLWIWRERVKRGDVDALGRRK